MTVVAALRIAGHPFMLADLLLSGPVKPESVTTLPSVEVTYKNASSDYKGPVGLCQKIAVVADNLVIGWSGRYDTAMDFVGELRMRCKLDSFDPNRLMEYINMQPPSTWKEIRFAGFITHKEGQSSGACATTVRSDSFGLGSDQLLIPTIGKAFVIGSGRELLIDYLKQVYQEPPNMDSDPNLAVQAVLHGASMIGDFLSMEQFARESLEKAFGGGYELAVASHGEFIKLNVLYAFWRVWVNEDRKTFELYDYPFLLFRYEYFDDLLVIRTIAMLEPAEKPIPHETIFKVPPVYRYLTAEEKDMRPRPQLKADWTCNLVQVVFPEGKWKTFTIVGHKSDWVKFKEVDGEVIGLSYSTEFHNKICESVNNLMASKGV